MVKRFFLLFLFLFVFSVADAVAASRKSVRFRWDPVSDSTIVAYRVSYGFTPAKVAASFSVGMNTSFTLKNLRAGQTIYFSVQSENAAGVRSAPSDLLAVRVSNRRPPSRRPPRVVRPVRRPSRPRPPVRPRAPVRPRVPVRPRAPVGSPATTSRSYLGNSQLNHLCGSWNTGFTDRNAGRIHWNLLRLENTDSAHPNSMFLRMSNSGGLPLSEQNLILKAGETRDIVLNDLLPDAQSGEVCLDAGESLKGRVFQILETGTSSRRQQNFLLDFPLQAGMSGPQVVSWNNSQPNLGAGGSQNVEKSWLTVLNLESAATEGSLVVSDEKGVELLRLPLSIPGNGRSDLDFLALSHQGYGQAKWIPESSVARVILSMSRYYSEENSAVSTAAVTLEGTASAASETTFSFTPQVGRNSVVELLNPLGAPTNINIEISTPGRGPSNFVVSLPAFGSQHLLLGGLGVRGSRSLVRLKSDQPGGLVAYGFEYEFGNRGELLEVSRISSEMATNTP